MILLDVYLIIFISLVIHELMHAIVAVVFRIKITKIKIGVGEFSLHLSKRLSITPFFFGGYVEVDPESLLKKKQLYKMYPMSRTK